MLKKKCFILSVFLFLSILSFSQNTEVEKQKILQNEAEKKEFDKLLDLHVRYVNSDIDKATLYIKKAAKLSIVEKDKDFFISLQYSLGRLDILKRKYAIAIKHFNSILNITEPLKDKKYLEISVHCYSNLGIIYLRKENLKKALFFHKKAFETAEKEHLDNAIIARTLNNLSTITSAQHNFKDAIYYLKKSVELKNNESEKEVEYINLGMNYIGLKKYSKSEFYLKKGLTLSKKSNNKTHEAAALFGFATLFDKKNEFKKSLRYHFETLVIEKEMNLKDEIITSYGRISTIYLNLNQLDSAAYYTKKYESLLDSNYSKSLIKGLKYDQANYFAEKKKYQKAFFLLKDYIQINDSILDLDVNFKISEIKEKYESEKKEKEITFLKSKDLQKKLEAEKKEKEILILKNINQQQVNEIETNKLISDNKNKEINLLNKTKELQEIKLKSKQLKLDKEKRVQKTIVIASIIILLPIVFLLLMYRQKLNNQKLMVSQREKIDIEKGRVIQKNQKIIKMKSNIDGQLIERKRIAKELHDGLGGNLAGIKVRLMKILKDNPDIEPIKVVIKNLDDSCEEVRTISHDLIPPNMDNEKFTFLVEKYVANIVTNQNWKLDYNCYPEELINKITPYIKIEIYRIVQELFNNIQKHANTNSVDFQLIKHDNYINIFLEDYGEGFDETKKKNGIGLQNIRDRVAILKGKITIDTQLERGTIINIIIPDDFS